MTSSTALQHPWIRPTSNIQENDSASQKKSEERKINTKNLRRFVIRRRWQVSYCDLEFIMLNKVQKRNRFQADLFRIKEMFKCSRFFLNINLILESCERSFSSQKDGNEFMIFSTMKTDFEN